MKQMAATTNLELAKLLRKIAAAYTLLGENRFKVIAYDNAATAVEHATSEIKALWEENKLDSVPGLGTSIRSHLEELFKTGRSKHFDSVLSKVNPAVFPLLDVPGLGPKKAQKIVEELNIKSVQDVFVEIEKAIKTHKIASIPGFGAKSEQDILEGLDRYHKGSIKEKRLMLPQADTLAEEIISYLAHQLGKKARQIDKLGSLRRQVATIGDLDLAVATSDPEEVIATFIVYPGKVALIERGPTGASILLASGRQCDLRVCPPDSYGAMLQYFTGSKYHNIRLRDFALKKGLSLNEYGIKNLKTSRLEKFSTEKDFYGFLGLPYIPPEIREDAGEIEAALNNQLPNLVELQDIRGDLQMHSNFDLETSHDSGQNSIAELQDTATKMGYGFLCLTNHNPSVSKHTPDEIVTKLKNQGKHIEQLNTSTSKARILSLLEVDILPNGDLSVPQAGLNLLDGCLVSIHSNFGLSKTDMTARVLKGLSNPVARIFAHPTGRLLEKREGYELDFEKIPNFCLENDKALEINSHPSRLDLPDILVREAVKRGVKLSLGTDSHSKEDLVNMRYGVAVARRGWAEKKNIINCWSTEKLLAWLHKRGGEH